MVSELFAGETSIPGFISIITLHELGIAAQKNHLDRTQVLEEISANGISMTLTNFIKFHTNRYRLLIDCAVVITLETAIDGENVHRRLLEHNRTKESHDIETIERGE